MDSFQERSFHYRLSPDRCTACLAANLLERLQALIAFMGDRWDLILALCYGAVALIGFRAAFQGRCPPPQG